MIEGICHCGAVRWSFKGDPGSATACNCTICRRYGALWIYGWEGHGVETFGETMTYVRGEGIGFHFCPSCGCVTWWRGLRPRPDGRTRIAVNTRMAEPEAVAHLPIRHFDGLDRFKDLPHDGHTVRDLWF
ncbi:GFA family protein [Palleronia sp. KMU-117]|uniref:GFA family protein n=1 Tax=Palleronia sp. KMU-117 TaxID=3434108 RepID=UPI003D72216C